MSVALAVVVDDWALAAAPGLDRELAEAGALVMRAFRGLPNPALLARHPGAAVIGGPDRDGLLARLERATATLRGPVIAILPRGVAPSPELRGPGVVDLVAAGSRGVAERVLLMARVPVVRGHAPAGAAAPPPSGLRPVASGGPSPGPASLPQPRADGAPPDELVAVASSTGGVWILAAMLRALRPDGRAVAVAQHLEAEFVAFFAGWLRSVSGWPTMLVEDAAPLAEGIAYVAAGGLDLLVRGDTVHVAPAASRYVPSGDRLLASAAEALGPRATGLVLSGMGADGAEGLAAIARRGGRALCQDPASAVVPSMPEAALRRTPGALRAPPDGLAPLVGAVDHAASARAARSARR